MFSIKKIVSLDVRLYSVKKITLALIFAAIIAFLPAAANAQRERTITKKVVFGKGKEFTVIRGTAQPYTYYSYLVSAKKNQYIIIDVNSPNENVYVSVFEPGAPESLNDPEKDVSGYAGDILKTGVYKVLVYTKSDAGASPFTMEIKIK